jgi:hypothetical protein
MNNKHVRKNLLLLRRAKEQKQQVLETELGRLNALLITVVEDIKQIRRQIMELISHKVKYTDEFYNNVKAQTKTLMDFDKFEFDLIEISKIQENLEIKLKDKHEEETNLKDQINQLQNEIKQLIINREKYKELLILNF